MVVVVSVFKIMIEKVVRAFLLIFILVALAMIVATLLGFSTQVEEFLKTVVPTRYQIIANSDTYFRILSMGMLILAVPVIFMSLSVYWECAKVSMKKGNVKR